MAVGLGLIVGGGVRVDNSGAAKVGNGDEAALVVVSQADNTKTNRQHRIIAKNLKRLVFISNISCILFPVSNLLLHTSCLCS
jgi:hypothetical protein